MVIPISIYGDPIFVALAQRKGLLATRHRGVHHRFALRILLDIDREGIIISSINSIFSVKKFWQTILL